MACWVEGNSPVCLFFVGRVLHVTLSRDSLTVQPRDAGGNRQNRLTATEDKVFTQRPLSPSLPSAIPVLCAVFSWIRYMCPLDRLLLVTKPPSPLKAGLDSAVSTSGGGASCFMPVSQCPRL